MLTPTLISMSHLDRSTFRVVLRLTVPGQPSWVVSGVLDKRAGTFRPEGALVRLGAPAPWGAGDLDLYVEGGEEALALAEVEAWARRFAFPPPRARQGDRAA